MPGWRPKEGGIGYPGGRPGWWNALIGLIEGGRGFSTGDLGTSGVRRSEAVAAFR